jgi:hypothetical protein
VNGELKECERPSPSILFDFNPLKMNVLNSSFWTAERKISLAVQGLEARLGQGTAGEIAFSAETV